MSCSHQDGVDPYINPKEIQRLARLHDIMLRVSLTGVVNRDDEPAIAQVYIALDRLRRRKVQEGTLEHIWSHMIDDTMRNQPFKEWCFFLEMLLGPEESRPSPVKTKEVARAILMVFDHLLESLREHSKECSTKSSQDPNLPPPRFGVIRQCVKGFRSILNWRFLKVG